MVKWPSARRLGPPRRFQVGQHTLAWLVRFRNLWSLECEGRVAIAVLFGWMRRDRCCFELYWDLEHQLDSTVLMKIQAGDSYHCCCLKKVAFLPILQQYGVHTRISSLRSDIQIGSGANNSIPGSWMAEEQA
jgi:hypothetical protein